MDFQIVCACDDTQKDHVLSRGIQLSLLFEHFDECGSLIIYE